MKCFYVQRIGEPLTTYPPADSPLRFDKFFESIYQQYDLRFVYAAPNIARKTRRLEWDPDSPALTHRCVAGMTPRVASAAGMSDDAEEASDAAADASPFD